jgi:hypothetical protein
MSAQGAINVRNKVSDLQSKLSHAAKQSLDRRFGALYDKIYREDIMFEAWCMQVFFFGHNVRLSRGPNDDRTRIDLDVRRDLTVVCSRRLFCKFHQC